MSSLIDTRKLSDLTPKAFNLCSRAYCGVFDCLDEKIGQQSANILKTSSCAISAGASISFCSRIVNINFTLLTGWQTAGALLCAYSVMAASYVIHQYVTEALCKHSIKQILEKNGQHLCGKKTAVIVSVPPLDHWDHLKNISGHYFTLRRNIRKLSQAFDIQLVNIQSIKEWNRALDSIPDASIDYLLINAHGYSNGIVLNKNQESLMYCGEHVYAESNSKKIQESLALIKKIGIKIKKNAKVILNACSTGFGPNSLQKGFETYCPEANVYAPPMDIRHMYLKDNFTPLFV